MRGLLKKPLTIFGLVALLFILLTPAALAADFRAGNDVTIPTGETVSTDLYWSGNTLVVDGVVRGDVVAAGNSITINGHVTGDVIAGGSTLDIHGLVDGSVWVGGANVTVDNGAVVGHSLRAGGANVTMNGTVRGDLLAGGTNVTLGDSAKVTGDVAVGGTVMTVRGAIGRDLYASGAQLTFLGQVARDMKIQATSFTLDPSSHVGGNFTYTSPNAMSFNQSVINGTITHQIGPTATTPTAPTTVAPTPSAWEWWANHLKALISLMAIALLVALVMPRATKMITGEINSHPFGSILSGFISVIVAPVLIVLTAVLLIMSIVAGVGPFVFTFMLLGAFLTAALMVGLFLGSIYASIWLGSWMSKLFGERQIPYWVAALAGILVMYVVLNAIGMIPTVGGVLFFLLGAIISLFGLGALLYAFRDGVKGGAFRLPTARAL